MAEIILKMLAPSVYTFHIKNRESFNIGLDMPTIVVPSPERPKEDVEINKLDGNIMRIDIVFILKDYTGDVATLVDELTGSNAVLTPQQQIDFLINTFENKSIMHKYNLSISGVSPPFSYDGIIDKIQIEQSQETAHNYRCSISFAVGKVIAVDNE